MAFKLSYLLIFALGVSHGHPFDTDTSSVTGELFSFFNNLNLSNVQPECRNACRKVLRDAEIGNLSSLKILDATAKLPSGILRGNINQYGDFDECMSVEQAQYCLAEIDLEPLWDKQPVLGQHRNLAHSYYVFREKFNDPAHRLPGFTMSRWGVCTPRQCSSRDVEIILRDNLRLPVQIREGMCQKAVKEAEVPSGGYKIAKIISYVLGTVLVLASLIDWVSDVEIFKEKVRSLSISKKISDFVTCFSLRRNWRKFLEIPANPKNEILSLDAIRCFSAVALFMAHRCVSVFFNPYINRTAAIEMYSAHWTIIIKNAIVYTDCFLLISGLLTAHALLTDLNKKGHMHFKQKLMTRLFRILPNLTAIILFSTYFLPLMSNGPLWPSVIQSHSKLCKKYMWRNMLFIHNYFGFENMCLTHTHQLGMDMQLFIITPILIYLVSKSKKLGLWFITLLIALSAILRFWVVYIHELNTVVYYGIPISKMFEFANRSYILPTHRASIYLIGVYLACILHFSKTAPTWNMFKKTFLWCFFLSLFFGTWFGPSHMSFLDYVYDAKESAWIAALTPILWGSSLAFAIYVTNNNMGGYFRDFVSWKYWKYGSRISYSLYLIQFPVYFYNVGRTKNSDEYRMSIQFQVYETAIIVFLSLLLTLTVEMPFINLIRILLEPRRDELTSGDRKKTDTPFVEDRKFKSG